MAIGIGGGAKIGKKQSIVQKVKSKVNPVNSNKSGWMKEQAKKRTTVVPAKKK